ncbi:hypothetical protein D3C75_1015590 [compost metagenome]
MKHADVIFIDIDKFQIVELLQHEMAGIEQHLAAWMSRNALMEHFKGNAIMQIFAGVDLITQVDALLITGIEHG